MWFVAASGLTLISLHAFFSYLRYRKIKSLSRGLESILHGTRDALRIDESVEGELAVLQSEVQKLINRLHEQSRLLQQDKLILQEAIADIFHQIRTPLTAMNIAVSRLSKVNLPDAERLEITRDIKRQLERSRWLTETLLKMSKIDAGTVQFRREEVRVQSAIDKALSSLLIPMELAEIDLVVDVRDEAFSGDLDWTAEAISNLAKNAIEHFLHLSQDAHPLSNSKRGERMIRISALETALYTQIIVEDTGGGFDEADIPRLFDRYFKGRSAGPDSIGIGLSLSRMIIASQNGTITASNAEQGARFTIRFYKSIV